MKKLLAFALSLLLCMLPAMAEENGAGEDLLLDKCLELAALVGEKASTEAYYTSMSSAEEILQIVRSFADLSAATPASVFRVRADEGMKEAFLDYVQDADISPELLDEMYIRTFTSIPTLLNSTLGVNYIAASSILASSVAFVGELQEKMIYFLQYDEVTLAVAFTPGQDGAVTASACPISKADVREYFTQNMVDVFGDITAFIVEDIL